MEFGSELTNGQTNKQLNSDRSKELTTIKRAIMNRELKKLDFRLETLKATLEPPLPVSVRQPLLVCLPDQRASTQPQPAIQKVLKSLKRRRLKYIKPWAESKEYLCINTEYKGRNHFSSLQDEPIEYLPQSC